MKRPGQSELARHLGLSQSTVSLALRGDARVAAATGQRVREAAGLTGYRPHAGAAHLAESRWARTGSGRSPVLAFLDTVLPPEERNTLIPGASSRADSLGYRLEVIPPSRFRRPRALVRHLAHRGIQGLILSQQVESDPPFDLPWDRFCVVACGLLAHRPTVASVEADLAAGVEMACQRLPEGAPAVFWLREEQGLRSERVLADAARAFLARRAAGSRTLCFVETRAGECGREVAACLREMPPESPLVVTYGHMLSQLPDGARYLGRASCLFAQEAPGWNPPGPLVRHDWLAEAAVSLLDEKLRRRAFGLADRAPRLLIPPVWYEPAAFSDGP